MDRYSYDPNSRVARRIKERERKKRRNRKIRNTVIVILIIAAAAFAALRYAGGMGISLPEFNPAEGFNRLIKAIGGEKDAASDNTDNESADDSTQPKEESEPSEITENVQSMHDSTNNPTKVRYYPLPSENNNFLDIFKNAQGETEKICCLTFDDGPNKTTTPEILDTLAKYDVKASFFELGEKLEANKDIAKRTYDEGHLLANHTYTQKYSTLYTSWDSFWDEVQRTEALITDITGGSAFKIVRMPGGSFNSGVYGTVKQEYRAKLAENDYYFIDWNVDNGDDGTRNTAEVLSYVKDYCGSKPIVLLMEDSSARRATVNSLGDVIEYLKKCGYVFKRLDEIKYYTETQAPSEPTATAEVLPCDTFARGIIK